MEFPSRKSTSKGSLFQEALGGGTLGLFHTLHPGLNLGSPFEPQALP